MINWENGKISGYGLVTYSLWWYMENGVAFNSITFVGGLSVFFKIVSRQPSYSHGSRYFPLLVITVNFAFIVGIV